MRKAVTVGLAIAIAAGGIGVIPAWAGSTVVVPDNKSCSKHEYERVERGMTKAKVTQIIGAKGMANYGGEDFTGYLYGGMPYRTLANAAGCNIAFKQGAHEETVIHKDGWFPQG